MNRHTGKRGRRPTFSDAAIQFCLSIKCLFGLALRQALGFVHSLLRLAVWQSGSLAVLQWPVPDYSTLSRRQQTLKVQLPYRPSTTALDLLVDSTGIKFLGEGEWKRKKHGAEYRRQWRKVHLGIDAQTLEIRAIEVTDNSVGDAPVLPHLLAQIPPVSPKWGKHELHVTPVRCATDTNAAVMDVGFRMVCAKRVASVCV